MLNKLCYKQIKLLEYWNFKKSFGFDALANRLFHAKDLDFTCCEVERTSQKVLGLWGALRMQGMPVANAQVGKTRCIGVGVISDVEITAVAEKRTIVVIAEDCVLGRCAFD